VPASTSGDFAAGGRLTATEVRQHGLFSHVDHPRDQMYLISRAAIGYAEAIPALIHMVQSAERMSSPNIAAFSGACAVHPIERNGAA
jgi:hypothetical protein